jgi:hypothetical protein
MKPRLHPYDLVFGYDALEGTAFPAIRAEAETRGVDFQDREGLTLLEGMGEIMRAMLPADAGAPAFAQFNAIAYQAFNYWLSGKRTFEITDDELRTLLAVRERTDRDMTPPAPAGYVRLPRNLVFARVKENVPAEAVDGFFFVMPAREGASPPYSRLDILLVLGLVPNRAGYSVVEMNTSLPEDLSGRFIDAPARESGEDFENILPGGEGRLYAVTNTIEVLKMVSGCFRQLDG